jgi:HK97 family phage prohead protease
MKFDAKDIVGKKFELKTKLESINNEEATAVFVLSTSDIDRHGDVVDQDSWILENFMNNPVFLEQHMSGAFPLGKFIELGVEQDPNRADGAKRLVGKVQFAVEEYERAKVAFALVSNGFMSAVSVGFVPNSVEYNEEAEAFIMRDCELLEVSLVSVPANPMALAKMQHSASEKGIDITPLLKKEEKQEETPRSKIIKAKEAVEEEVDEEAVEEESEMKKHSAKKRALHLLHKACRAYKI